MDFQETLGDDTYDNASLIQTLALFQKVIAFDAAIMSSPYVYIHLENSFIRKRGT